MREPLITEDGPAAPAPAADSTSQDVPIVSKPRVRPLRHIINLLHDLAIAVVICALLITFVVQAFKVQGTSMVPELRNGERILVNKFIYNFRSISRGDVVVFWYTEDPDVSFIKRVVALPGDSVEIKRGKLLVNGELVDEPYVKPEYIDRRSFPSQEIRAGHYFVLGDNRRGSNDSRSWGLVPQRYIYGKAFLRIWPPGEFGTIR
jgi:signal peptidase I